MKEYVVKATLVVEIPVEAKNKTEAMETAEYLALGRMFPSGAECISVKML